MSKNSFFREIIPDKVPKRIWGSKDYSNIILYALEVFGPIYQQEFVNRGRISNRIPEKTFYNHIKRLKTQGYLEFNIDQATRRNSYIITIAGERFLKQKLQRNENKYGNLYLKIEDFKFLEKKEVFSEQYTKYLNYLEKINTKFIKKLIDLSHFYSKDVLNRYPELNVKIQEETKLKKGIPQKFSQIIKILEKYQKKIELDLLECEVHIFESGESDNFQFKCPRCKDDYIITYEKTLDCVICGLEFEKVDFKLIKDLDDILSIEEKKGILQGIEEE